MFLRALAAIAALFLVSCGSTRIPLPSITPYRIEIQQGNFVSQEMVSQLKLGMSKDQVRFVLGTPLITDSFHADRWDYVFRRQRINSKELEHRKIAVFFEDGKLKRIEGDVTPSASTDAAGVKLPEASTDAAAVKLPEAKPEAQPAPAAAATPESKPAEQSAAEAVKPAQASVPEKPAAAPVPSGDKPPQEKSWWEKLKDKVKF
jgi:outer membrane protein assembly factor BamE